MKLKIKRKPKKTSPPGKADKDREYFRSPAPPKNGNVFGLDNHPEIFTAAEVQGKSIPEAQTKSLHKDIAWDGFRQWALDTLDKNDLVVMEAGSNSFEVVAVLTGLGFQAIVIDSYQVSRLRNDYVDTDAIAAVRIAHAFLTGAAKCVWVPDQPARQGREILHRYQKAVTSSTAAVNALRGLLTCNGVRLKKKNPKLATTHEWILTQKDWSEPQLFLLRDCFDEVLHHDARRKALYKLICRQIEQNPQMKVCMKILGVSVVTAFALLVIIGDVKRFATPARLVSYLGLNPGRRQSGTGKDIGLGIGSRGRRDLRSLLIQGAQAVLQHGSHSNPLRNWGWRLFARKGIRNVAVAAVARKMAVQVWHVLMGNDLQLPETDKSLRLKLRKLAHALGKPHRLSQGFGSIDQWVQAQYESSKADPEAWGGCPKPRQAGAA